jgi:hypothetical protein
MNENPFDLGNKEDFEAELPQIDDKEGIFPKGIITLPLLIEGGFRLGGRRGKRYEGIKDENGNLYMVNRQNVYEEKESSDK